MSSDNLDAILSLAKRRGFIFPSSSIYGGFSSVYDYGPLGAELKNNIKKEWWRRVVQTNEDIVGVDSAILMSPKVWEASGHLSAGFADPLVECKKCHERFRSDKSREEGGAMGEKECPKCKGELTESRKFNLMMKTFVGPVEDDSAAAYLRAETAQGIFMNYKNVLDTSRVKVPFGIAQIGKAFRNEITPGNFIFRTREFEQMELEYFVKPEKAEQVFEYWKKERMKWYLDMGLKEENLRFRDHEKTELAHYARSATDIEYKFPFGWKEIEGIHDRGDWDLSNHAKHSGEELKYRDPDTGEEYYPYVIETSAGADRSVLVFLADSLERVSGGRTMTTESSRDEEIVLNIAANLAPIKVAILPLVKNKLEITSKARNIFEALKNNFMARYDEQGSIGRRYRRQDEIGTPYCVTVDFDSLSDNTVTLRDRKTMTQERIASDDIPKYLLCKLY
ncbi:MAG: glycine--tRNA ligase [Candidatus Spechtbacteria bacterium RIFCSPHIGHO2_02_FULL_43_15b]|uniref:Glycine--tRNA ligase n=1 Tax=Candidatus Spechtbacteria bacterium RIFCSPHIGHO2_01_FULL_43_30 TaxID=1802158 RepID=A0A1G2H6P3_9BACT|nr:MAG: glycine--tRNA ligase [Candidatus Spechtbacteria bacterium RIFCSPHIGHO2_01_FULL_43_30]OGZ60215.1 MAG: glycine--tRNA ligase [Candidatus Spechtbacteria bacterium RIFCSPHIGHO2_02_FULL_43_15b]